MSKQKQNPTSDSVFVQPASLQDAGYKLARTGEATSNIAGYVLAQCPTFLDDVPAEIKTGLYAGFQLRKHELTTEKFYKLGDNGSYIPLAAKPADNAPGIVCMSINVAMSYSAQEFGKMRETDPAKHAIVKPMRDAFSDYAGNCMRDLKAAVRRLVQKDQPRQRGANKAFREAMTLVFNTYEKRVKTAKDRGDNEADVVKFKMAVNAFWKTYDA